MIRNYFKTALRSFVKNKAFSAINVFGLSLSMAVCLIIIMLVGDQMSMDRYNKNANNIYRINMQRLHEPGPFNVLATTPIPLGNELIENYSGIKNYCKIRRGFGNDWVGIEND
ncbi:MAG: ABC transporter permease, partial [Fulvivirga sp.]